MEPEFPRFELIVAADRNLGIAKEGKIPWKLPTEFAYYRKMSTSPAGSARVHASVYGRKTWDSIPVERRPWGNTICFIMSQTMTDDDVKGYKDVYVHPSLESIVEHLKEPGMRERIDRVWIHGGYSIYKEAIRSPHFYRLYWSKIDAVFPCDTFMPRLDEGKLRLVYDPDVPQGIQHDSGMDYQVLVYESDLSRSCPLVDDE